MLEPSNGNRTHMEYGPVRARFNQDHEQCLAWRSAGEPTGARTSKPYLQIGNTAESREELPIWREPHWLVVAYAVKRKRLHAGN